MRTLVTTAAALALMFGGTATALADGDSGSSSTTHTHNHSCTADHTLINLLDCDNVLTFEWED